MTTAMNIEQKQKQIVSEFQSLPDWEARYKQIIDVGRAMPTMPEEMKTPENKVKGCQSQVWITAKTNTEGKIIFQADSDASIVKGLIALLLRVYSEEFPADIITHQPHFLQELGLDTNLSQTRVSGLVSMVKQIKYYAMAFQAISSANKKS